MVVKLTRACTSLKMRLLQNERASRHVYCCSCLKPTVNSAYLQEEAQYVNITMNSHTTRLTDIFNWHELCSLWGRHWIFMYINILFQNTVCPTRYRTRNFLNNYNTNESIATKFEQEYVRCVGNEKECVCSVCSSAGWSDIARFTRQHGRNSVLFRHRVISKGLWPPRSPDLTPSDYFLWVYLKGRVYQNKPRNTDALKANITEEIQAVTADVLARTSQNTARGVQSCLDANGGHFQHMLWCRHISCTMR